jgi:hypothetical protein
MKRDERNGRLRTHRGTPHGFLSDTGTALGTILGALMLWTCASFAHQAGRAGGAAGQADAPADQGALGQTGGNQVQSGKPLGLPADRERLYEPEDKYVRFPLPSGDQKYASVDGLAMKKTQAEVIAISEKSRGDGYQYWGRITGTAYDRMTSDWALARFQKLGLEQVRRQELDLPPQWFATSWQADLVVAGKSIPLKTAFPAQGSLGTPNGPVEADAVWVGLGTAADFMGRDVKGKAVFIYSWPTPGGRDHSALYNGSLKRAHDRGAALIFMILGFPGNATAIASITPPPVPTLTVGQQDGMAVREAIEQGGAVKIRMRLDVKTESGLKTNNVWGVLPGQTEENILILAHHDAFFDGALDNASGMAMLMEIGRYYAAVPKAQRRRTLTFLDTSGHHATPDVGAAWVRENMKDFFAKTALIVNCEHPSQTQIYYINNGLMTSNSIDARRWYAGGSDALKSLVFNSFKEFGVTVYTEPEPRPGGELSQLYALAPSFHLIDHIFYHTDLDTSDWTPAWGMEAVARAYLKIIDSVNRMDLSELKGNKIPTKVAE